THSYGPSSQRRRPHRIRNRCCHCARSPAHSQHRDGTLKREVVEKFVKCEQSHDRTLLACASPFSSSPSLLSCQRSRSIFAPLQKIPLFWRHYRTWECAGFIVSISGKSPHSS